MQNDAHELLHLYLAWKCSSSNRIIGTKGHASIQMNMAEVDKVIGRFNVRNLCSLWAHLQDG
uniref:Uncharacterized protein n=1 Tax=Ailuropoda melanoleuca TaxID=9646 RepID=A0A7N5P3J7_AILME